MLVVSQPSKLKLRRFPNPRITALEPFSGDLYPQCFFTAEKNQSRQSGTHQRQRRRLRNGGARRGAGETESEIVRRRRAQRDTRKRQASRQHPIAVRVALKDDVLA